MNLAWFSVFNFYCKTYLLTINLEGIINHFNEDAIFLDGNGEIMFSAHVTEAYTVVRFLANELANTKAELWFQSLKAEKC